MSSSPGTTSDRESLQEAVRSARRGQDVAHSFRTLVAQLAPRLRGYFRGYSFPDEEGEDLVQAVLTRMWQGLSHLQAEESFLPWLFTIARNVRCAAWQSRQRERTWRAEVVELSDEVADPRAAGIVEDQAQAERMEEMLAAIEDLPPQQRQCLLLRVRDEQSYEDIAVVMRLSLHTVRNHIAAAKKSLRRRLRLELADEVRR
jgi:RNA polymerase sigma-70 factor, ECF subfamily